ncbi:Peptide chain release factor 3 [Nitrospira moscoviensis]|uniref:Peptide chain release factor 3 n=2 Tax=Nitrospira moscoviensis TaxID=42253 RepID=A0A0K2GBV2_NITMO|nr:Peptide chain release factor 3 [Nitrospira moscoviensis]
MVCCAAIMTTTQASVDGELAAATAQRRTFAIISHPDAGKTTLTEKLLLYSGMIRTAGMVRGRKGGKVTASDWMGMEQERGISITASAMQFHYKDAVINLLDTPGHQDFSEDTYRTLTAADSAIMVIDAAKGVEAQTRKLFAVCRLRRIPVLTLVNKLDLPGRPPLDLMTEVEQALDIQASAINWPVGSGSEFAGIVTRADGRVHLFSRTAPGGAAKVGVETVPLGELARSGRVSADVLAQVRHDLELLDIAGNPFSRERFLAGEVTPVFFASALTNFGVEHFLDAFVALAPSPGARPADAEDGRELTVDPIETPFSAYVFKLQANMNPKHRDSTAFLRICSGRFERDMVVKHHRLNREVRLARPHSMVAQARSTVEEAFPGDIIGIINPGLFAIGDTISLTGGFNFKPLPQFQPELFARIRPTDVGKRKAFDKGLSQMAQEGTVQIMRSLNDLESLVAAVGRLQFDVLQYRLRHEYRVETVLDQLPYTCSAWLDGDPATFKPPSASMIVKDQRNRVVVLFGDQLMKTIARDRNPDHLLRDMG